MTWLAIRTFLGANWIHIAIALAIVGVLAWDNHEGYARAEDHFKAQEAARDAEEARLSARIHSEIADGLATIDRNTADRLAAIDHTDRTVVQPVLEREIANDPRYNAPACTVSEGVLGALNAARAASGDPAAAGADGGRVPGGAAAPRR